MTRKRQYFDDSFSKDDGNHHLYRRRRGGTIYFQKQIGAGYNAKIFRCSLHTKEVKVARQKRDIYLAEINTARSGEAHLRIMEGIAAANKIELSASPILQKIKGKSNGSCEKQIDEFLNNRQTYQNTSVGSLHEYRRNLNGLVNILKIKNLAISKDQAKQFTDNLRKSRLNPFKYPEEFGKCAKEKLCLSAKSVNNIIRGFITFYDWLQLQDYVDTNPWKAVPLIKASNLERARGPKVFWTYEQVQAIFSLPVPKTFDPDQWHFILWCGRLYGSRLAEICGIHGSHVYLDMEVPSMKQITQKQSKASHDFGPRLLPIPPQILPLVIKLKKNFGDGHLVPDAGFGVIRFKGAESIIWGTRMGKVFRQSIEGKIPGSFHVFRGYATSEMTNAGVPDRIRCRITGHSGSLRDRDSISELYTEYNPKVLLEAIAKVR